jgi:hypothetical protein
MRRSRACTTCRCSFLFTDENGAARARAGRDGHVRRIDGRGIDIRIREWRIDPRIEMTNVVRVITTNERSNDKRDPQTTT